jgi:hypothetical protein
MSRPTAYRSHPPKPSLMDRQPVRTLLLPVALLAFAAAAQAFINGADVRGVVTAVLGVLIVAATEARAVSCDPVPGVVPHA